MIVLLEDCPQPRSPTKKKRTRRQCARSSLRPVSHHCLPLKKNKTTFDGTDGVLKPLSRALGHCCKPRLIIVVVKINNQVEIS